MIALEEMSELSKELLKYLRIKRNPETVEKGTRDKIVENMQSEIADVLNCTKQLAMMFGYDEVYRIREQKVARAMDKMEAKMETLVLSPQ